MKLMKYFSELLARRDALEDGDTEDAGGRGGVTDALLAGGDSGEPLRGSNPSFNSVLCLCNIYIGYRQKKKCLMLLSTYFKCQSALL